MLNTRNDFQFAVDLFCLNRYVTEHLELVTAMLQPRVSSLPADVRALFIQNAIKVFSAGLGVLLKNAVSYFAA